MCVCVCVSVCLCVCVSVCVIFLIRRACDLMNVVLSI